MMQDKLSISPGEDPALVDNTASAMDASSFRLIAKVLIDTGHQDKQVRSPVIAVKSGS